MNGAAYYNENDPFAAAWLRELIKAKLIADGEVDERSIELVSPNDLRGFVQCHFFAGIGGWSYAMRLAGWPDDRAVWTGSCPCQPWSVAGRSEGTADPRHLWPAWFRLIAECRPPAVFGEQVASLDGLYWLDLVYVDLEAADYALGAVDLCAASAGAPHARARLWFVADTDSEQLRAGGSRQVNGAASQVESGAPERQRVRPDAWEWRQVGALDDTERHRTERIVRGEGRAQRAPSRGGQDEGRRRLQARHAGDAGDMGHAHGSGLALGSVNEDGRRAIRLQGAALMSTGATRGFWDGCDWLWHRDGVYRAVESGTFPLVARLPGDVEQIHCFGNAIVPQVAQAFIESYCEARGL